MIVSVTPGGSASASFGYRGIGTVGGVALAWMVTRFGFEIAWAWTPASYAAAVGTAVALSVVAGLAASTRALAVRPLTVLRHGE